MFDRLVKIFLLISIAITGILYFKTTTDLVAAGAVISDFKKEIAVTLTEKQKRAVELTSAVSLSKIEQEAQDNGLTQDSKFVYISTSPSSLAVSKK